MLMEVSMRKAFVAPPGWSWLSLDYSGQETRIAAAVSRDEAMLNVYRRERDDPFDIDEEGNKYISPYIDLHYVSGEGIFPELLNLPGNERLSASKKKKAELNGDSQRGIGKTLNFGIIYGLQASSIAEDFNWHIERAEETLRNYFKKFHSLERWLKSTSELGKAQKWIILPGGRKLFIAESNAKGVDNVNAVGRKACNAVCQGTASDMMKLALRYMDPIIESSGSKIACIVHD
jgi:DNA polymerase-1